MKDLKAIFQNIERALRDESSLNDENFDLQLGQFKKYKNRELSDDEIYNILVMVTFYSGMKASTVDKKKKAIESYFPGYEIVSKFGKKEVGEILSDNRMIRNKRKIEGCINNAITFKSIIGEFGSFKNYLDQFKVGESFENLLLLKEELEYKFDYLGDITTYHFLTDLGYDVIKPDRVIQRIFKRLGMIENEKQLLKSVIIGRKVSQETETPLRFIDIILVKYGQEGGTPSFGLANGICLENKPRCQKCGVFEHCGFEKKNTEGNNG